MGDVQPIGRVKTTLAKNYLIRNSARFKGYPLSSDITFFFFAFQFFTGFNTSPVEDSASESHLPD